MITEIVVRRLLMICEGLLEAKIEPLDFDPQKTRTLFDLDLVANRGELTAKHKATFRKLLSANEEIVLYHGTSIKHDVWNKGLLPTSATRKRSLQSGSGFVYLTYDPMRALTFAQMGYPSEGPFVVYAVTVPVKSLRADPDQLKNKRFYGERTDIGSTLIDSMIHGAGARVKGKIEQWRIKVFGYFDNRGNKVDKPDRHIWN